MRGILYTDGASKGNPGPAGIGVYLLDENGEVLAEHDESIGYATNNVAEYRALIKGLQLAAEHGITHLRWYTDSELLARQWQGVYAVHDPRLHRLFLEARDLAQRFEQVDAHHLPREHNRKTDSLARRAIRKAAKEQNDRRRRRREDGTKNEKPV